MRQTGWKLGFGALSFVINLQVLNPFFYSFLLLYVTYFLNTLTETIALRNSQFPVTFAAHPFRHHFTGSGSQPLPLPLLSFLLLSMWDSVDLGKDQNSVFHQGLSYHNAEVYINKQLDGQEPSGRSCATTSRVHPHRDHMSSSDESHSTLESGQQALRIRCPARFLLKLLSLLPDLDARARVRAGGSRIRRGCFLSLPLLGNWRNGRCDGDEVIPDDVNFPGKYQNVPDLVAHVRYGVYMEKSQIHGAFVFLVFKVRKT
ncbi:hypothetical protein VTG60DRAFT_5070 [Thermothelomyces hinnuleus]